jgi:hypothetical protein
VTDFKELRNEEIADSSPVAPKAFNSLPLGAVKPVGWLYDQVSIIFSNEGVGEDGTKQFLVVDGANKWLSRPRARVLQLVGNFEFRYDI